MTPLPLIHTPPRLPFGELTETPTPTSAPGASLPHRPLVIVQQFSLKSRRAHPYPCGVVPMQPGDTCLKPPKSVAPDMPCALVKLCSCSWQGTLKTDRARLCERSTTDHEEYFLLNKMCLHFAAERAGDEDMARPVAGVISTAACLQQLEVHFIIEPLGEQVVGYVAFRRGTGSSPEATTPQSGSRHGRVLRGNSRDFFVARVEAEVEGEDDVSPVALEVVTLVQIYVVPDERRKGLATSALAVLLAGRNAVIVESTTSAVEAQLLRLGFTQSARRRRRLDSGSGDEQGVQRTLYTRRELLVGASNENMENI